MADRITITGLRVNARHGVFEQEKQHYQDFLIDITVWIDLMAASATDDLAQTMDYGALATRVADIMNGTAVNLIETLAGRIAEDILADHRVHAVEVTIHKPHAPMPVDFADVAVTIRRSRKNYVSIKNNEA